MKTLWKKKKEKLENKELNASLSKEKKEMMQEFVTKSHNGTLSLTKKLIQIHTVH